MLLNLLIHDATRANIGQLTAGNAHAILIDAPAGAGKRSIALAIAAHYLGKSTERHILTHPYVSLITPEKGSIGIDKIRDIKKFVSLRTTGTNQIRRILLVEEAHTMTTEAQNALLKILEEPPADTILLLTCSDQKRLKTTVISRVQTLSIIPPPKDVSKDYFLKKRYAANEIERAFILSKGYAGLMSGLLSVDKGHPLVISIERAKQLFHAQPYERLAQVDEMSKNKDETFNVVSALKRISLAGLDQAARKNQAEAMSRWHKQLAVFQRSESLLLSNTNTKLVLTDMFLQM